MNCECGSTLVKIFDNVGISVKDRSRNQLFSDSDIINHYKPKYASNYPSLPRYYENNILEIPVSLPDDDILERLRIKDSREVVNVWGKILEDTNSRGELFTLQLHPERISIYQEALRYLIHDARRPERLIWFASLDEIADWWKERANYAVRVSKQATDEWLLEPQCTKKATLLVNSFEPRAKQFFNNYAIVENKNFTIRTSKKPVIGVSRNSSPKLKSFLRNEGFQFEVSSNSDDYAVFLDLEAFEDDNELGLLNEIDNTDLPFIRFWRWPSGYRSVLAVTGDIDALTIRDFFFRGR